MRLSKGLPVSRQAVTKHLRVLAGAGVVRTEKRGREQLVALQPAPLSEASSWLERHARAWDLKLALLKDLAERP
jgi:DNA-binding transcriptional ArsR family regulator